MASLSKPYENKPPLRILRLTNRQVELIEKVLGYATLIAVAALFVLPLYWMLSTAVKTPEQTFALPPQ